MNKPKTPYFHNEFVKSDRLLYTPSNFAKSNLLHLQEIGELQALKSYTSGRNDLCSYLFIMVKSGSGILKYNGEQYDLTAGDCVFIDCRKEYYHQSSADLWTLQWIHFYGPTLPNIYEKYTERGGSPCFHPPRTNSFTSVWEKISSVARSTDYIRDMRINESLNTLLTLLMEESWHPEAQRKDSVKQNLLTIKHFLDENYEKKISLDELSARFYINKFYLTRIFKEQFGLSVNSYLLQLRITRAKNLLRFSDKTVEAIGLECGIGAVNYFSRTFKKIEGVNPSEYRKEWLTAPEERTEQYNQSLKETTYMNYMTQYNFWTTDPYFDASTRAELLALKDNTAEIEDRFYRDLEFGTGGLRGVIGAGTNRINIYTVRKASQGLANYILKQGGAERGIAIAYDSRRFSPEFAEETALCMAANGIKAYIFDSLRPTPELSFALRKLGCISGVVITASHNPPEYNGYKVYWEDGAQITAPRDKEIITEVNAVTDYYTVKTMAKEDAVAAGLYVTIGKEIDDAYMMELKKQIIHPEVIKAACKDLKIVYSPFNGTGNVPVCRILQELGFEQLFVVPEQQMPDPDFTTLEYPNPEDPNAFTLALALAKKVNADIVLATDPDADRLGIYVLNPSAAEYIPFTGNMSGMLICEYILRERTRTGTMPHNPTLVSTIVTTDMAKVIAKAYHVDFIETLTGFKYIGEQIKFFEESGSHNFVFGLEESYGCLAGTHARDKDAVVAVMCLCEVASWCKTRGITLWDMMSDMYERYGYYKEGQYTITLKGIDGSRQIAAIMDKLRTNPPKTFGDKKVTAVRDYKTGNTGLPISNVLYFELENDCWCCARPSGTEPKIKFYMGVKGTSLKDAEVQLEVLTDAVKARKRQI